IEEPAAQRLDGNLQAILGQFLLGQGGAEVGVLGGVGGQDGGLKFGVGSVVGGTTTQAVDQAVVAVLLEFIQETADVARGEMEQTSGLGLGAEAVENRLKDLEAVTFGLTHGNAVGGQHDDRHGSSLA